MLDQLESRPSPGRDVIHVRRQAELGHSCRAVAAPDHGERSGIRHRLGNCTSAGGEALILEQAHRAVPEDSSGICNHIIELGRSAPDFPDEWREEGNRLRGCQSQVWLKFWQEGGRLFFLAVSDSAIVSGLAAILMRDYSGRRPSEILDTPPDFIAAAGLDRHLSPTRSNGLNSMVNEIRRHAVECL